jgi:alkanesulfonate monooxygenase SsuD/methylene tetrahydromethanopterin reductase-like flavin-dependent oxidoreductase (luciferase family)
LFDDPADHTLALSVRADALGFGSVWLAEHVVTPARRTTEHPYWDAVRGQVVAAENDFASTTVLAGAIAAATARIQVALGVLIMPLRHPLLVARDLVTLSEIAPGRVVLGAGAGWLAEEFAALGVPFGERFTRLEEAIAVIREALRGGPFEHHGPHYDFDSLTVTRDAADVPLMMGGRTAAGLRRAAMLGDGWYAPSGQDLESCLACRAGIEETRREHGLTDRPYRYVVRVQPYGLETAERFRAAGFDELVLGGSHVFAGLEAPSLDEKLAALDRAAQAYGLV